MLRQRILTALVMFAVFLPALFWLPPAGWAAVSAVIVGASAHEWAYLSGVQYKLVAWSYAILTAVLTVSVSHWHPIQPGWYSAAGFFWVLLAPWLLLRGNIPRNPKLLLSMGGLLLVAAGIALIGLRAISPILLILLLASIWLSDSSAYFTGRAFGRHKLAPGISPGKTWEGVFGALLAVLIYACISAYAFSEIVVPPWLSGSIAGVCATIAFWLLLAIFGIMGDLMESLMKRAAGVKDSGNLLPGHGGMLDRIDALVPMLPLAALFYFH